MLVPPPFAIGVDLGVATLPLPSSTAVPRAFDPTGRATLLAYFCPALVLLAPSFALLFFPPCFFVVVGSLLYIYFSLLSIFTVLREKVFSILETEIIFLDERSQFRM